MIVQVTREYLSFALSGSINGRINSSIISTNSATNLKWLANSHIDLCVNLKVLKEIAEKLANVLHVKKDVALLLCVHLCIYSTLQKQFCLPAKKILVPKGPVSRTIRTVTVKLVYYRLKTTKCSYCVWNYRFTFFSFCILSCCRFTSLTCSSAIALSLKIKNKHILFIIQKAPRAHAIY